MQTPESGFLSAVNFGGNEVVFTDCSDNNANNMTPITTKTATTTTTTTTTRKTKAKTTTATLLQTFFGMESGPKR